MNRSRFFFWSTFWETFRKIFSPALFLLFLSIGLKYTQKNVLILTYHQSRSSCDPLFHSTNVFNTFPQQAQEWTHCTQKSSWVIIITSTCKWYKWAHVKGLRHQNWLFHASAAELNILKISLKLYTFWNHSRCIWWNHFSMLISLAVLPQSNKFYKFSVSYVKQHSWQWIYLPFT